MRIVFGLFFSLLLVTSCKSSLAPSTLKQNALAFELCELYGSDQGLRTKALAPTNNQILPKIDSINFIKLVAFVQENGMPNENLLGKDNYAIECVKMAGFSILLHNPEKLVHDTEYYHLFFQEVQAGRMSGEVFALIIDKYYWARQQNLAYGSSFGQPCLHDKSDVNQRRKLLGLKELEDTEFKECTN